jgi:DNA-binding response OmpR family regulator
VTDRESTLVIDDDPELTSVLREFLKLEGYAVDVVHRAPPMGRSR